MNTDLAERPRLSPRVTYTASATGYVNVRAPVGPGRYFRIREHEFAVLATLDGSRTVGELCSALTPGQPGALEALLARFAECGLLEGSERETAPPRLLRVGWLSWQLNLFDPSRALRPLSRAPRWVGVVSAAGAALAVLLGVLGAAALARRGDLLARPDAADVVVVALLVVASTLLHEFAHAATLAFFGGAPRRMGLMLFYLAPAAFSDVSDAWMLRSRGKRAVVAAAGVAVNAALAGVALFAAAFLVADDLSSTLVAFAAAMGGLVVANLNPFVRLDGYWIVCAAFDVPNLRARAIHAVTCRIRHAADRPAAPFALLAYGAVALCAPLFLVVPVLATYAALARQLQAAPPFAAVGAAALVAAAVFVVGRARRAPGQ